MSPGAKECTMQVLDKLYEGKAKIVYATDDPHVVLQEFKDAATAGDGAKKGTITDKGRMNTAISAKLFQLLEDNGVRTHFRGLWGDRAMFITKLDMLKLECVVRNIAAGSLSQRIGYPEGTELKQPIVEFYLKDDALHDPLLTPDHIRELGLATDEQLAQLRAAALKVNDVLRAFFRDHDLLLVDFKLEFGRDAEGNLVLGDEISPDTCRLWDATTHEKLDKDRFRRDMGGVEEAYQEVVKRIGA
jgi:phosphoribosylaminoimidazole-succinocarboxamide synthase